MIDIINYLFFSKCRHEKTKLRSLNAYIINAFNKNYIKTILHSYAENIYQTKQMLY